MAVRVDVSAVLPEIEARTDAGGVQSMGSLDRALIVRRLEKLCSSVVSAMVDEAALIARHDSPRALLSPQADAGC